MESNINTASPVATSAKTESQIKIDTLISQITTTASKSIPDAIMIGLNAYQSAVAEGYDHGKIYAALDLANIYIRRMRNLDEGMKYLDIVEKELKKQDDPLARIRMMMADATAKTIKSELFEALEIYKQVEENIDEVNDVYLKAMLMSGFGAIYYFLFKFDKAMEYYYLSLKLYQAEDYHIGVANCYNNIATLCDRTGDKPKAIVHFKSALEKFEMTGDTQGIARATGNISLSYCNLRDYDKALEYGLRALEQARANKNEHQIALVLNNVGEIYKLTKQTEKALELYQQSLEIVERLHTDLEIAVAANNIGECYADLGKFEEMRKYLDYALPLIKKCNALVLLKNNHFIRSWHAHDTANYHTAFHYLEKYMDVHNKIVNEETARKTAELRAIFEVEKMEQEKEIYRLKNVELAHANQKLQEALDNIKVLSGLVPICSHCKKIRDDKGFWNQLETYISKHSDATFSHGICPDCLRELYPDIAEQILKSRQDKKDSE